MSDSDLEILIASQEAARKVLSDSGENADRFLTDANQEALAILREQQEVACRLLRGERADAVEVASLELRGGRDSNHGQDGELPESPVQSAKALLDAQFLIAEALLAAQRKAAEALGTSVDRSAVDNLILGQREAASILLAAGMRVLDGRSAPRVAPFQED